MQRLLTAIQTLDSLKDQKAALEAMLAALQSGKAAFLTVADHPGRIQLADAQATAALNQRLSNVSGQLTSLQAKLTQAESLL